MGRLVAALVLVLVVAAAAPGIVAADVEGQPSLSFALADRTVEPGAETSLRVTVQNAGIVREGSARNPQAEQRVTTARATTLTPEVGTAPLTAETDTVAVGSLQDGASRPVEIRVSVDRDADPGEYDLPVRVRYRYTSRIAGNDSADHTERTVDRLVDLEIEVAEAPQFAVVNATTSAPIGGSGTVAVAVRNTGEAEAANATVWLSSRDPALTFGGAGSAATFVGDWPAAETRVLTYEAAVAPGTEPRRLGIGATVSYADDRGRPGTVDLRTGVTPSGERAFALQNVTADLRAGEEGVVAADLVNRGPRVVENAVLVAEPRGRTVDIVETDYPVGRLGPNESRRVRYRVELSESALPGPRQLQFHLRYEDGGTTAQSGPMFARADVAPDRPVFAVSARNQTVTAGSARTLEVAVTNERDETLTDVSGKLFPSSPLASADDEAFVDTLAPGETAVLRFRVSASGAATAKTYPLPIDFQYDDADGDTLVSDTYKLPIEVTPSRGGGFLWLAPFGGLGVGAVAIAAFVLHRRR